MPSKTNLFEAQIDNVAKWLSCNGEVWGMGPTAVFASAAALFLYNELEETVFVPGDVRVSLLEKTLVSTMVLGMLALMVHLWVCSMRFFQYYLDTIIKDSPGMLLEMTTVGLLGGKSEIVPLGPLMRFLRQQQPQIHITVCWFLSLCYADYVRKHYCQRFNMPYLEQWQTELQARASRGVQRTVQLVSSFVSSVQTRLQVYAPDPPATDTRTGACEATGATCGARASGHVLQSKSQLLCQSSATNEAIEKLRAYIAETRCLCPDVAKSESNCTFCTQQQGND